MEATRDIRLVPGNGKYQDLITLYFGVAFCRNFNLTGHIVVNSEDAFGTSIHGTNNSSTNNGAPRTFSNNVPRSSSP